MTVLWEPNPTAAAAVVRAIRGNRAASSVGSLPVRPFVAMRAVAPQLIDRVVDAVGVSRYFARAVDGRGSDR